MSITERRRSQGSEITHTGGGRARILALGGPAQHARLRLVSALSLRSFDTRRLRLGMPSCQTMNVSLNPELGGIRPLKDRKRGCPHRIAVLEKEEGAGPHKDSRALPQGEKAGSHAR